MGRRGGGKEEGKEEGSELLGRVAAAGVEGACAGEARVHVCTVDSDARERMSGCSITR